MKFRRRDPDEGVVSSDVGQADDDDATAADTPTGDDDATAASVDDVVDVTDPFDDEEPPAPPSVPAEPAMDPAGRWAVPLEDDAPAAPRPVEFDAVEFARAIRRAVARALAEDLGDAGDVTSAATVPPLAEGTADIVARADGVVAGTAAAREAFAQVDPRITVEFQRTDGDAVEAGDVIAVVSGRLRSLLTAERVALNFLGHLSGVATKTRSFATLLEGTGTRIRDTRKTTPGLRLLEKAAVVAGGGANHRIGLYDQLLVKDNHVLAAGSIEVATRRALQRAAGRPVQVEVTSFDELDAVLAAGADSVLLDNFTVDEVRSAVRRTAGRALLEASGNITLATARDYAEAGVDTIATGSLTHSAPWLDIALDVHPTGEVDVADPADLVSWDDDPVIASPTAGRPATTIDPFTEVEGGPAGLSEVVPDAGYAGGPLIEDVGGDELERLAGAPPEELFGDIERAVPSAEADLFGRDADGSA